MTWSLLSGSRTGLVRVRYRRNSTGEEEAMGPIGGQFGAEELALYGSASRMTAALQGRLIGGSVP